VRTAHGADRIARQLAQSGLGAAALHGRMAQGKRERTLAEFAGGGTPVLVATNVAARGLHVDGVDIVIHFDPPEDPKTFLHRSGRTARAGEAGLSVTLVLPEQARDMARLQHDAGLNLEIVPMNEHDPRLLDLAKWSPPPARANVPPTYEERGRRPAVSRKPLARSAPRAAVRAHA
jgi:superfamily II DNA/RNA helicase